MIRKQPTKLIIRTFTTCEFDFIELSENDLNMNMFVMLRDKKKSYLE